MTLTLRVEDFVPYTSVLVAADCRIDMLELNAALPKDILIRAVDQLRRQVDARVDEVMKERGIVLDKNGVRK